MILASNEKDRRAALKKLLPLQRKDFDGVFRAMDGFPVTIRTLDPPLHEFLPRREDLMVEIAVLEATKPKSPKLEGAPDTAAASGRAARSQSHARTSRLPLWASPILKSPRCKLAQSSKLLLQVAKDGVKVFPKS